MSDIIEIRSRENFLENNNYQIEVGVLEQKIDNLVYELYNLTPEEVELVEASMKK